MCPIRHYKNYAFNMSSYISLTTIIQSSTAAGITKSIETTLPFTVQPAAVNILTHFQSKMILNLLLILVT